MTQLGMPLKQKKRKTDSGITEAKTDRIKKHKQCDESETQNDDINAESLGLLENVTDKHRCICEDEPFIGDTEDVYLSDEYIKQREKCIALTITELIPGISTYLARNDPIHSERVIQFLSL